MPPGQRSLIRRDKASPLGLQSVRVVVEGVFAEESLLSALHCKQLHAHRGVYQASQLEDARREHHLVGGGIEAQTERVLENIRAVLKDQGLGFANVVKTTVFMTNLGEFAQMNAVYARYFHEPFPARSTIQVAALPKAAAVEIEFVAHFSTP